MTPDERLQAVTDEVVASFGHDDRLAEIMRSLTTHLHAFARDVRLTRDEWTRGIGFLTRTGHITDERRQEVILLSDVLGLSMLTVGINAAPEPEATESTVFGPFFVDGAPEVGLGGDIAFGAKGMPCWVSSTVTSTTGEPIPGARIEVWVRGQGQPGRRRGRPPARPGPRTGARSPSRGRPSSSTSSWPGSGGDRLRCRARGQEA